MYCMVCQGVVDDAIYQARAHTMYSTLVIKIATEEAAAQRCVIAIIYFVTLICCAVDTIDSWRILAH